MEQLKSDIVKTELFENGYSEYIEGSDIYTHTELEATIEADVVKRERHDSMTVDSCDTWCMAVTSKDNDNKKTDIENDLRNTVVKTEQNYYEDEVDIKMETVNDYGDCNDITNCDGSVDGYSSDSTLVLDTKPDIEELSDQMQNSCMENAHNLDVSCSPNVKQIMNMDSKAENNGKIEVSKKFDGNSTEQKKKFQDKLEFESTPNFILCDEIKNENNEINQVNTLLIPKSEINVDESGDFWETNDGENNLLVKRLVKLKKNAAELYSCTECDYKCKLKISLTVHMKTHKGEKYFSCDRCNYKSKLRHGLNLHMKQKHADVIFCDLCYLKFKSIDDLFRHSKIHFGLNSYACHLCLFETVDRGNFVQHLRDHAGKKTYVCQYCNQKFSYKTLLNKHMLLHTKGEKSKTSNVKTQKLVLNEKESGKCYACNWCVSKFVRTGDLARHLKTHSIDSPFVCHICEQNFSTKAHLNRHVLFHTGEKPYACQLCDKKFCFKMVLKRHMRVHTSETYSNSHRETQKTALQTNINVSGNIRHTCELCDAKFVLKGHLTRHMKTHTDEKAFLCDLCSQKFPQKSALKKHMFMHTGERPFACDTCPYKCTSNIDLMKHKITHTSEKPYACTSCDQNFTTNGNLNRHVLFHTGEKPYACQLCDKKFCFKKVLKKHMWVHTNEKYSNSDRGIETQKTALQTNRNVSGNMRYTCELCDSKFVLKGHLTRHMKTHSGEKAFVCDLCGRNFSQKSTLKKHMFTHTGERPFACDTCPYRCTSNIDLVKHKMTHTGEKPFACTYCDFRCNRSYSLITHTRIHTGEKPYSCELCAYKCTRTSQLVRHMRTHTGEKRFSCDLCDFKCTRHCNLQMHMRIHTGDMLTCDHCYYMTTNKACLIIHNKRHTTKKLIQG